MASEGVGGSSSGGQLEERLDLTNETNDKITQATALVESSSENLTEALAILAALEKRCRVGNDSPNLVKVCETSLQLCKDCSNDEALIATLKTLSTRRSQKTKAVSALVSKALPWVLDMSEDAKPGTPLPVSTDEQKKIREEMVICLRDITNGKIFLEAERARLTRALATLYEQDGKIAEAADTLQEVHVETYGAISKREKVEFILEQMRLTLAKRDWTRAAIVSRKINRKAINEEGMQTEKVVFFTLLAEYHRHEKDAFELAKDYHAIYLTPSVQAVDEQWKSALQNTVLFLALSAHSMEQQDMLNRINIDTNLEKIEFCRATIKLLLKKEIITYPTQHQTELESLPAFSEGGTELTTHWHDQFHKRVIQHNIRVASTYYKRIHGARLADMLGLELGELEKEISSMVSDGSVYAKIDRPKDIVRFLQAQSPESTLSAWAGDITTLLDLVEKTTHLINKENMTKQ
eukprot:CAMPEP_0194352606 /NCGR_PEP_ID=MMETSP0174-20130528/1037_1 /TAXON_ID=216777 /ORGANISM="Proboscia alata, Strain PI-D3" /LENGTH=464 /DNA_ID=CAMNT_0039120791 /DNA_START=43 /DNA_END=1437 /DNA_ORIENTATION=+